MPRYEIQPITDDDGEDIFSVVDVLDLSGNNEVAVFWTRHEAVKFIAISNDWQDLAPYTPVSLRNGDEKHVPAVVYIVKSIFLYGREV